MKFVEFFILFLTLILIEPVFSNQPSISSPPAKNKIDQNQEKESEKTQEFELEPAPLPTHDMGSRWSGVRMADGVSTYKLKENSKVIGTFHLQKQDKKLDWDEIQSKDFFKKFVQRKEEWLRIINIRGWTTDQHNIRKRKDFIELNISGSYRKPDGKQIFFKERQLFFSDQVYQILVISPDVQTLRTKSVRDFFKKAQEIGRQKISEKKQESKGEK
ncbi:MAG: hypothetical protein OXK80_01020 [Bdellovibrionales bacterium]|nr:hypothetical protein [Bdellovibrionales bacterium]